MASKEDWTSSPILTHIPTIRKVITISIIASSLILIGFNVYWFLGILPPNISVEPQGSPEFYVNEENIGLNFTFQFRNNGSISSKISNIGMRLEIYNSTDNLIFFSEDSGYDVPANSVKLITLNLSMPLSNFDPDLFLDQSLTDQMTMHLTLDLTYGLYTITASIEISISNGDN